MTEIEPTPPVEHIEPEPEVFTYLIGFNEKNYQNNFLIAILASSSLGLPQQRNK